MWYEITDHSQKIVTSKFRNEKCNPLKTLLSMWLIIHARIKVKKVAPGIRILSAQSYYVSVKINTMIKREHIHNF